MDAVFMYHILQILRSQSDFDFTAIYRCLLVVAQIYRYASVSAFIDCAADITSASDSAGRKRKLSSPNTRLSEDQCISKEDLLETADSEPATDSCICHTSRLEAILPRGSKEENKESEPTVDLLEARKKVNSKIEMKSLICCDSPGRYFKSGLKDIKSSTTNYSVKSDDTNSTSSEFIDIKDHTVIYSAQSVGKYSTSEFIEIRRGSTAINSDQSEDTNSTSELKDIAIENNTAIFSAQSFGTNSTLEFKDIKNNTAVCSEQSVDTNSVSKFCSDHSVDTNSVSKFCSNQSVDTNSVSKFYSDQCVDTNSESKFCSDQSVGTNSTSELCSAQSVDSNSTSQSIGTFSNSDFIEIRSSPVGCSPKSDGTNSTSEFKDSESDTAISAQSIGTISNSDFIEIGDSTAGCSPESDGTNSTSEFCTDKSIDTHSTSEFKDSESNTAISAQSISTFSNSDFIEIRDSIAVCSAQCVDTNSTSEFSLALSVHGVDTNSTSGFKDNESCIVICSSESVGTNSTSELCSAQGVDSHPTSGLKDVERNAAIKIITPSSSGLNLKLNTDVSVRLNSILTNPGKEVEDTKMKNSSHPVKCSSLYCQETQCMRREMMGKTFLSGFFKSEWLSWLLLFFQFSLLVNQVSSDTSNCTITMQGRIEGSDLFMYPEHSGCLLDGVTKWEGGPENKHLTSNGGRLPNTDIRYVPVKMNGTYGLRIKNFTAKDYNCSYVYWLKFKTINVYPPNLGIQPDKEAINISCNVAANKVKIDYSVMGLFFKLVIEVKLSIGNLTRELNRTFVQQTDGTFMMEYSLKNDVCNGTLEVSYFFQEFPEIEGNLLNKRGITAEECPGNKDSSSGDHSTAVALAVACVVIIAVVVGVFLFYFYRKKKFLLKEEPDLNGAEELLFI